MSASPRYRQAEVGGVLHPLLQTHADGTLRLRSTDALEPYPSRLTDRLEHWATTAPDRVFVARRGADGTWITLTYAQMLDRAQRVGQALCAQGLSAERPLVILSENDLEHLTLALGGRVR